MKKIGKILSILAFTFVMIYSGSSWAKVYEVVVTEEGDLAGIILIYAMDDPPQLPLAIQMIPAGNYICVSESAEQSQKATQGSATQYKTGTKIKTR